MDALGLDAFPAQVLDRIVRVGEQELGELVGDDAVDLLRHRAVEAPQARLDVCVRDAELDEHERRRKRRVDVARHEREVGSLAATIGSSRCIARAVCSACEPDPMSSRWAGSGRPSWSMKISESSAS